MNAPAIQLCRWCGSEVVSPGRRYYCSDRCCHAATRHAKRPEKLCASGCGELVPKGRRDFCSDRCRCKHYRHTHPAAVAKVRERSRRWAVAKRGVKSRNYWLAGPPPYVGQLPGGLCWIDICPEPQWPIVHRNVRALHGVLSTLFARPHGTTSLLEEPHARLPAWSLRPCSAAPSGWAVYWSDPAALALAGHAHQVHIFNEQRALYLSALRPASAPRITKRGHRLVRIDAVTPVVIQSADRTTRRQVPEASNILSTLRLHLAPRLGLSIDEKELRAGLVHRETQQEWTDMGGKYGRVPGWIGHLVLDCNAATHWLLEAAASFGLGGRVAFGFGCVHVEEVQG